MLGLMHLVEPLRRSDTVALFAYALTVALRAPLLLAFGIY